MQDEACKFCCTKLENISVSFDDKTVLENVTVHLHCGELTVLIGKNGAGKSTLLRAIIGSVKHSGKISFASKHKKNKRLSIGYVPQTINIDESPMSVYDLICSYTSNIPTFLVKSKDMEKKIQEHLKEFGVDTLIHQRVSSLSGGQLQRVLLANATMPYPELLILDEPASGIDEEGKSRLYDILEKLTKTHDISILMVSHDLESVQKYADKVVLINKKILAQGSAKEVFASKEYAKEFGGAI